MRRVLASLLLALLLAAPSVSAQTFSEADWSADFSLRGAGGYVYASALGPDGHIYVAGDFDAVNGVENTQGIARWNTSTQAWEALGLGVYGRVEDIDFLSDGTLVAVGNFTFRNSTSEAFGGGHVALWDGSVWSAPGGGTTARVQNGAFASSVAADGMRFYLGGNFYEVTQPSGARINVTNVARWNGAQFEALGAPGFGTNGAALVRDLLAEPDGTLLVAGDFDVVYASDGTQLPLRGIARWDESAGAWTGGFGDASTDRRNGAERVDEIVRVGRDYYVRTTANGTFYQPGGSTLSARFVAKWDGSAWSALGAGGSVFPPSDGVSEAAGLHVTPSGDLVVLGAETAYDGATATPTHGFARWAGTGWMPHLPGGAGIASYGDYFRGRGSAVSTGTDFYAFVEAFAFDDPSGTTETLRAARFDGSRWNALGASTHGGLSITAGAASTLRVVADADAVYVGGHIDRAGSTALHGFGRYDRAAKTWSAPGELIANGNIPQVHALALWGDRVVFGGLFDRAKNPDGSVVHSQNVIAWNTTAQVWESFGDGTQQQYADRNGVEGVVRGIATLPGGDLVVVGDFDAASQSDGASLAVQNVVIWDASEAAWALLAPGAGEPVGVNKDVLAVATDASGQIYVAGKASEATQPDGTEISTNRIVRWDGARWHTLGAGVTLPSTYDIADVAVSGSEVYVAGSFYQLENADGSRVSAQGLARWDGAEWHAMGGRFDALQGDAQLTALVPVGGNVIAGGQLSDRANTDGSIIWAEASTSEVIGSGLGYYTGELGLSPQNFALDGSSVFAVGGFQRAGQSASVRIAEFTAVPTPTRLAAPLLTSPADGTLGAPVAPALAWSTMRGATSYDVQVSTDADFATLALDQSALASPGFSASGLSSATRYFVRVRARNASTLSAWSTPASFVTVATVAPGAVALASPDDAAESVAVSARLRWQQAAQAFAYRVQVATDPGFSAPVLDANVSGDTTAVVSPALAIGTAYYWRVRASNNIGDGPWSAARSFTTASSGIPAPVLTSPDDLAENQSTSPRLSFTRASGAGQYRAQVAEIAGWDGVPDWSAAVKDETFGNAWSSSYSASGLTNGTRYAWRIQGIDGSGDAGPWSEVRRFKTTGVNPAAPPTPALLSPANYGSNVPIPPDLTWSESAGATGYDIQISEASSTYWFESQLVYTGTSAVAFVTAEGADLQTNTNYYWRVRAENDYESAWSSIFRFRTSSVILPRPTLVSPAEGATEVPASPTFEWTREEPSDDFQLQVSATSDFAAPVIDRTAYDTNAFAPGILLDGGGAAYFWRVRQRVSSSTFGPWSAVGSFTTTTAPPPGAPQLLSPGEGGTIRYKFNTFAPYVTWLPADGATSYQLQFTTDGSFTDGPTLDMSGLAFRDDYFFAEEGAGYTAVRVRAVGAGGAGAWSAAHAYTLQSVSDAMPFDEPDAGTRYGSYLVHGGEGVALSGTAHWDPAGHASTDLDIATDAAFTNIVTSARNIAIDEREASAPYSGLALGTRYFFRLRPSGGAWSSTMFFETSDGVPNAAPALTAPEDEASGIASRPTFEWNATAEATSYRVQVSTSPDFGTTVLDEPAASPFTPAASLAFSATHYWRVRGVGDAGAGPWSVSRSFTTVPPPPPAPELLEPVAGATGVPIATALVWTKPTGAERIHYEVARDAAFAERVTFSNSNEGRGQRITNLPTGTLLYVRLRAEYAEGALSEWSPSSTFTTQAYTAPTAAPTLAAPADAASGTGAPVTFTWNAVGGADRYQIHVATGPDFGEGAEGEGGYVAHNRTDAATTSAFDYAQANTTYWWRVRAIEGPDGSDAAGPWSTVRSFSVGTISPVTAAPVQAEPANGATGVHQLTTFRYQPLAGAQAYQVEVSQSTSFTKPVQLYSNGSATEITTYQAFDGGDGQTWYWRVRGRNSEGWGPWSGAFSFQTTPGAPPTQQTRITRPDFTGVAPRNPLVVWNAIPNVTSYDVEVARTFEFETLLSSTNVAGTSHVLTGLTPGVRYYARVRGRNATGAGPWTQADFVPRAAPSADAAIPSGDPPPVVLTDAGGVEVDFSRLASDATLSAERIASEPPGGFAVENRVLTTTQYWTFSLDGGGAFATSVCFPLSEVAGPVTDFTQLTIYKRDGDGDAWVAQATELRPPSAPTQICVPSVSSFSDFTVGAPEAALPVELTTFVAAVGGESVRLDWATASETNNAGFAVERRVDGAKAWAEVGYVAGGGTTLEARAYSFTDAALPYEARALHYRLRQVDYDGAVQYSAEIDVEPGLPTDFALEPAFPNPARAEATLRYALPSAATVSLEVYDALGRRVLVLVREEQEAGRYAVPLDARALASGVYFVRLRADGRVAGQRVTVVR